MITSAPIHNFFSKKNQVYSYRGHKKISYMTSPHLCLHLPNPCGTDLTQGTRGPSQGHSFEQSYTVLPHTSDGVPKIL